MTGGVLKPIYSDFDDILQLVRYNSTVGYNICKMYVKIEMTIRAKNNIKLRSLNTATVWM